MSKVHAIDFVEKKSRDMEAPYAVFTGQMFGGLTTYKVLKKYKNNDAEEYAAWMVAAKSPATFGGYDMGDTYIKDVVVHFSLTEVNGEQPTQEQFAQVAALRGHFTGSGGEVYTMTEIGNGAVPTSQLSGSKTAGFAFGVELGS